MSRRATSSFLGLALLVFSALAVRGQAPLTFHFEGFEADDVPTVVHLAEVESALTRRRSWLPPVLVQADGTCEVELPMREALSVWQVARGVPRCPVVSRGVPWCPPLLGRRQDK
jgi:hypothetical protein